MSPPSIPTNRPHSANKKLGKWSFKYEHYLFMRNGEQFMEEKYGLKPNMLHLLLFIYTVTGGKRPFTQRSLREHPLNTYNEGTLRCYLPLVQRLKLVKLYDAVSNNKWKPSSWIVSGHGLTIVRRFKEYIYSLEVK